MSKSITVTLPNATAHSLERYMETLMTSNLPPGARRSKSDFVATAIKTALEKAGIVIVEEKREVPVQTHPDPNHERMEL